MYGLMSVKKTTAIAGLSDDIEWITCFDGRSSTSNLICYIVLIPLTLVLKREKKNNNIRMPLGLYNVRGKTCTTGVRNRNTELGCGSNKLFQDTKINFFDLIGTIKIFVFLQKERKNKIFLIRVMFNAEPHRISVVSFPCFFLSIQLK